MTLIIQSTIRHAIPYNRNFLNYKADVMEGWLVSLSETVNEMGYFGDCIKYFGLANLLIRFAELIFSVLGLFI